ncbi:hypothetical protein LLEC1_03906 [Akanthomyces lecanii]|uniref:Uncharacterized protein n=1 Tax=Cordyceps confragosa TaxID=2714763 RepID=A0A179I560_CORDF|nr:hypothetical protein LLEC1_03906 [Akanthomyces lecanii]
MRYEDWDILLFPRDGKVPLKEFKVACHVVHDNELSHIHGSLGLPTVCCFVPSLPAGAPYKLSMHSWSTPPISQFTRSCGKFADRVVFEVRLFVDGRMVSSSSMNRAGPWPNVLKNSFDLSTSGELESLKFPSFQRELLNQSYWSPADDLGRIKVVISESYHRESLPYERLKNIVAFSFQHAPLEILESSSIAWPNSSMWRTMPFTVSTSQPTRQSDSGRSHAHSPRPRNSVAHTTVSLTEAVPGTVPPQVSKYRDSLKPPAFSYLDSQPSPNLITSDPFVEANAYFEWLSGIGMGLTADANPTLNPDTAVRRNQKSSTDTSMPDYVSSGQTPPHVAVGQDASAVGLSGEGDSTHMKVPANTPTTCDLSIAEPEGSCLLPRALRFCLTDIGVHFALLSSSTPISAGDSTNNSFLSQSAAISPQLLPTPAMEVKSRKENKTKQVGTPPAVAATIPFSGEPVSVRRVSQQLFKAGALVMKASPTSESPSRRASAENPGKRLRNFTPTSSKVFEEDEEPRRASPRVRFSALSEAK